MPAFARAQGKSTEPVSVARDRPGPEAATVHLAGQHEQQDQLPLRRSLEHTSDRQAAAASDSANPAATRLHWNFTRIPIRPPESPAIPTKHTLRERTDEVGAPLPQPAKRPIQTPATHFPPGDSLPGSVEESFTAKFRQDLSHVTVHHDAAASRAVRRIGASAFARGSEIFFAEGAFQPGTASGQALLAHELAHVIQQTGTRSHPSVGQPSSSEEYARRAARDQHAGADFLDAGPAAPLSLAADNGVAIEDEAAQQSVLLSDDELAERALDLQAAADKRRGALGGTDIATGKLDEKALQTIDVARASVARKQKAKSKENKNKTNNRNKNKNARDPARSGPNSSRDLSNATDDQVDDHLHQLRKAEILNPNAKERERLRREIENVQGEKDTRAAAAAAERKAQAEALTHQISDLRDTIKSLQHRAGELHDLRNSTSSWVTGPTHFWGGAWSELEPRDFAPANIYLNEATNAVKEDNLQYAQYLLAQSAREYHDLTSRFGDYTQGIERGVNRSVTAFKVAKTAGRVAASEFDPTGGFLYGSAQDLAGQASEVAYGQRESIDYKGIAVDNAINTAVSVVAGYGASGVSNAASPYLSQLGRFSGVGRSALEYTTNTFISSELTNTSFVDNLTDPTNLVTHVVGHGIAASKAQTKAAEFEPPAAPPPEAAPPQVAPPALAGDAAIPAPAAPASPVVHALPDLAPLALPGTATAATPAVPSAAASPVTHAPEPPSTTLSSSPTPTHSSEHFTGPKQNPIRGGGEGSGKPQGLLFHADKPTGRHIDVDASHPRLANKTAANDNNLGNTAQAARQVLQPTGTGDVAPAKVVHDIEPTPASNLSGATGTRASAGNPAASSATTGAPGPTPTPAPGAHHEAATENAVKGTAAAVAAKPASTSAEAAMATPHVSGTGPVPATNTAAQPISRVQAQEAIVAERVKARDRAESRHTTLAGQAIEADAAVNQARAKLESAKAAHEQAKAKATKAEAAHANAAKGSKRERGKAATGARTDAANTEKAVARAENELTRAEKNANAVTEKVKKAQKALEKRSADLKTSVDHLRRLQEKEQDGGPTKAPRLSANEPFDPKKRRPNFSDFPNIAGHPVNRHSGTRTDPKARVGVFKQPVAGRLAAENQQITAVLTNPKAGRQERAAAGHPYERMIGSDLTPQGAGTRERHSAGDKPRIGDEGIHEITVERDLSDTKLDQIWRDLVARDTALITTPTLSPSSAKDLSKLAAIFEHVTGRRPSITVRETGP